MRLLVFFYFITYLVVATRSKQKKTDISLWHWGLLPYILYSSSPYELRYLSMSEAIFTHMYIQNNFLNLFFFCLPYFPEISEIIACFRDFQYTKFILHLICLWIFKHRLLFQYCISLGHWMLCQITQTI